MAKWIRSLNSKPKPSAVAYVLGSFPEPSETFVADEALSVAQQGLQVCFMSARQGSHSVVQPSARALLDSSGHAFHHLGQASRGSLIAALFWLLLRNPGRTLKTMGAAVRSPHRWCYLQALVAARWCQRLGVEFLHAHFADTQLLYAYAISAWSRIPYGVTTHRYDILDDPLDPALAGELLRNAAAVVTISEFNRRHMVAKYGLSKADIQVVHCGVDLTRFAFVEHKPVVGRAPMRLLNVGRLVEVKGHDVLLHALARVRNRGVPFMLDVIGGGPLHEPLLALTCALGLEAQVRFHGARDESFVRQRLVAADVFVLPSRSEGLPVACIEALATGTPVIATRIFGIPELIEDGVTGLLVDADDADSLADAICRAWSEPKALARGRIAGRRKVEAEFERTACTRQLIEVWRRATQGADAGPRTP